MVLKKILLIAIGGSLGANARYWLGVLVKHYLGDEFPYATFIVNITGSFLLGMFLALISTRYLSTNQGYQWAISIGFLGSYTTFSTFEYETMMLAETGNYLGALMNTGLSIFVGLIAVWLGVRIFSIL
ncbi:MAG: fluoride efflux transporter CrcB [Candidatus Poribacteria bacterium]|nr:fluoride efflux transporter CrcB [Candidatus Poribacteria bacterium]